jgi:hypothetical protein
MIQMADTWDRTLQLYRAGFRAPAISRSGRKEMNFATVAFAGVMLVFGALALIAYVIFAAEGRRKRSS